MWYSVKVLVVVISLTLCASTAWSAEAFFQGKTMTVIVPYGVGGGYDGWARLTAPYLKRYLGLAAVEVVNRPGAGGLVGTDAVYAAKPDGLTIGDTNAGGDYFAQLAGRSGAKFDVRRINWIGRPDGDPHVIAVHAHGPYQSFEDLLALRGSKTTVRALATGKGSDDYNADVIVFNVFGIPFHMIAAFKGSHAEKATFLSGEGDTIPCSASCIARMGGSVKNILVIANQPFDKAPTVPTTNQVSRKVGLSSDKREVLKQLANVMALGHAFMAPPGVPEDRLSAIREAFRKTLHNPDFIQSAKKAELYLGYKSGAALTHMVRSAESHSALFQNYLNAH